MSADDQANDPGTGGTSNLTGSDAGTKGTGSAGRQANAPASSGEGNDAGTKGTGSAGRTAASGEGNDAGTKGTGSAG